MTKTLLQQEIHRQYRVKMYELVKQAEKDGVIINYMFKN